MAGDPSLGRCIEILERLVAFPTVSEQSNRALIAWVRGFLDELGLATTLVPSPDGEKANLFATLGPAGQGGLLLSGHSDVVPVEGQDWSSDPFTLTRRGERLYGRGTADMKGFIACALASIECHAGLSLKTPIHLALSYDEELGCLGIPSLIERLGTELPLPRAAIVGEPTGLRPINAHKGFRAFRTTFRGQAGHSSLPDEAVSAIRLAGAFLQALESLAEELRRQPPAAAGSIEPAHTTISAGRIAGGTAINIVPQDCLLDWEFRPSPGDRPEAVLQRLADLLAAALPADLLARDGLARIVTVPLATEPTFSPEPGGLAEGLLAQITGSNRCEGAAYGTEAGFFQAAGISTIVLGPGDIAQAHQPDEYVACDQLARTLKLLQAVMQWATENELTGT